MKLLLLGLAFMMTLIPLQGMNNLNEELVKKCYEKNKNLQKIEDLLNKKASVNYRDEDLRTPFQIAIKNKASIEILNLFIKNKADATNQDLYGEPLLESACIKKAPLNIIKYLVENKADLNACSTGLMRTPLYHVCRIDNREDPEDDNSPIEIVKYLIEKKADINAQDMHGVTILHSVCANHRSLCPKNEPLEIVKLLIEKKADVKTKDGFGNTALMWAVKKNASPEVIKILLRSFFSKNMEQKIQCYFCCMKWYSKKIKQIIPKPIQGIILSYIFVSESEIDEFKKYFKEKNSYDKTVLDCALSMDSKDKDIIELLNQIKNLIDNVQIKEIMILVN